MTIKTKAEALNIIAQAREFLMGQSAGSLELAGENIKERRNDRGYTQFQFSKLIRLSRTSVANIEAGRQDVTLSKFLLICQILETTPNELLGIKK